VLRDPLSHRARREVAECQLALGQHKEAVGAWQHTVWLKPNDAYVHFKLGLCHWRLAQVRRDPATRAAALAEARTSFDQAWRLFSREELKGKAWMTYWLGRIALDDDHVEDAAAHLNSVVGFKWTEAAALLFLGEANLRLGELKLASERFASARRAASPAGGPDLDRGWGDTLSRNEALARAWRGEAWLLVRQGNLPKAAVAIRAASRNAEQIPGRYAQAQVTALCRDTEALRLLEEVRGTVTNGADVARRALAEVREALTLHPFPEGYLHEAQLHEWEWQHESDVAARARIKALIADCRRAVEGLDEAGDTARQVQEILARLN
jgi:tetratricopeptide (TPR) repeat protein